MGKKWIALFLGILVIVMGLSGCSLFKGPQQKPPAGPQQPTQGTEPEISVYMHDSGETKTMKMEDYVAGVVAGEMKSDWPVEALAAQAILARTFTVDAIETKGGVPAHGTQASTDIKEFQAYNAKEINDNVRNAVAMTRGRIVTYQGKAIDSWFHSSAGGITATAKEGLNYNKTEPPYVESVQSPDDLAPEDIQNWEVAFTKQEVKAALAKMGHSVQAISSIEIGEKGPSGRAMTLIINKTITVPGPDFRVSLNSTKLKSMLLDKIDVGSDQVTFTGKGFGHGVGMSQWGANKLATEGKNANDIIAFYFKDVTIEQRWQ